MGDFESKKDEMKGRMKEAAGDLTDDDDLKREGKADRIGGTVKEKANEVVDKAKDVIDRDR
ncbi:MAG TPA: CsbD family protein [Acidimicrobiia bacterium]|nr:CsbD family protein [Acidimicrobiia bacterium]